MGNPWRKLILVASCLIGLYACVDPVFLPIRQQQRRLVVDGLITDEAPPYLVKLTYSGNLTGSLSIPEELAVNGARVTITDNTNRTVLLEQDPLNPAYYWVRDPNYRGQRGRTYVLSVSLPDGSQYQSSPELLATVPPLDSLYAQYRKSGFGQPDFYDVQINTRDPATPGNFYRWESVGYVPRWTKYDPVNQPVSNGLSGFCFCSCWVPYYGPLTNVLSDALVNGNYIQGRIVFNSPVYAIGNQYIQVRQFSVSRAAYQYWTLFEQQRTRSGSLFDPQPASIEGNVHLTEDTTQLALGFFGASAVSQQRLTIPADTINYSKFIARFGRMFIPPEQDCFQAFSQAQLSPPVGYPPR